MTSTTQSQRSSSWRKKVGFSNAGAVYVWIAIVALFSAWIPSVFLQTATFHTILNEYSITAIAALSVLAPLACGVFDLSIGANMGFTGVVAGWLLTHSSLNPAVVIILSILSGLCIGILNAIVVVGLRIDSFIGTLATGSILTALTIAFSGDQILTDRMEGGFSHFGATSVGGIDLPVLYMIGIMLLLAYVFEKTPLGRYMYATGYNEDVTRLVGINVDRLRIGALMFSGMVSAIAGVALVSSVSAADPSNGPSYLIPAFSAAFLGATQFKGGRFNSWGTVAAVLLLGTGSVGLLLAGAPQWSPQVFQGVVLIAAIGITVRRRRPRVALANDNVDPVSGHAEASDDKTGMVDHQDLPAQQFVAVRAGTPDAPES